MEELIEIRVNGGGTGSRRGNLTSIKGVDYAQNITSLMANYNRIKKVDLTKNNELTVLEIYQNYLEEIDVTKNTELTSFLVSNNELTGINIDENKSLTHFNAHGNSEIKSINFKNNTLLKDTNISLTSIEKVDVAGLRNLTTLRIYGSSTAPSKLTEVEVDGNNTALITLQINNNQVSDISNLDVLTNLTTLNASNQTLTTSTPSVDGTKKAEVDLLKTTAGSTLTTSRNGTNLITPEAEYGSDGDKAVLSNVTRSSLSGKSYNFSYSNLQEGATSGTKSFNGTVTFDKASDTNQTLEADKTKAEIGETVGFSWNVYSIGDIDMKDVQAKLDLPEGLAVDAESIKITNGTAISPPENFDNEISIGDIVKGASATITFNATVQDTEVLKWLTTTGTVTWANTTGSATRFTSTTTTKVQVKDDQQSYTPSNEDLAITSVPAGFNFGYRSRSDKEVLYPLRESDYQSNTKVPQNGFYVRVQNNQSTNSGWSLSASLSNFSNQEGIMPFGNGTSLNLSSMSIKNVLQPDTEDEIFNNSPTGIPGTVGTAELASGGSPQKLISAEQAQGAGTWQLQIPFNGVELQLPPNAGKTGEKYNATVSWSLDNTP